MNSAAWLEASKRRLSEVDIETARLDCLVLLEDSTGKNRAWHLAHPEFELPPATLEKLEQSIRLRENHVPLAYILGKVEFYGRDFIVSENTLIPRPESESMIELLKQYVLQPDQAIIADIGTGSGALAISAKLELPTAHVFATDIDARCIQVAEKNAAKLKAGIDFLVGDMVEPFRTAPPAATPTVLLCNLPYVPLDYPINPAAAHEPKLALYGGVDGLYAYRKLCAQLNILKPLPTTIITESLCTQQQSLADIFVSAGYILLQTDGLAQMFEHKSY